MLNNTALKNNKQKTNTTTCQHNYKIAQYIIAKLKNITILYRNEKINQILNQRQLKLIPIKTMKHINICYSYSLSEIIKLIKQINSKANIHNIIRMTTQKNYQDLSQYCIAKGCLKGVQKNVFVPENFALLPLETSREFYERLGLVHVAWQKLIYLAAIDQQLIKKIFGPIRQNDPWVNFLFTIYQHENAKNKNFLVHTRSDYFMDLLQIPKIIEYNLTCVGTSFMNNKLYEAKLALDAQNKDLYFQNDCCDQFISTIVEHYRLRKLDGIFAFLISNNQIITFTEQKYIQLRLMEQGIKCKRVKLKDLHQKAILNENNDLIYEGFKISIAYFRSGYQAKDYQDVGDQKARLDMRIKLAKSNATSIPNVAMELINTKRMQAELSKPQVMRKYLGEEQSKLVESSIIENYSLGQINNKEFAQILQKIDKEKDKWILKPNLEGGDNNLFGKEAFAKLKSMTEQQRKNYIVQKWIDSPLYHNFVIYRGSKLVEKKFNYQISRFGVISVIDGQVLKNVTTGHGIRSRGEGQTEGAVFKGEDGIVSWRQSSPPV